MVSRAWIAVVAITLPVIAAARPQESPRAFVESIYAAFDRGGTGIHPTARTAAKYFDPALVALIRADARRAGTEVPLLNDDPFCGCQDSANARYTIALATGSGPKTFAMVLFQSAGSAKRIELELTRTAAGWRVADVHTPERPSLRRYLIAGLRPHGRRTVRQQGGTR